MGFVRGEKRRKKTVRWAVFLYFQLVRFGQERRDMKVKGVVMIVISMFMCVFIAGCAAGSADVPVAVPEPEPIAAVEPEEVSGGGITLTDMTGREVWLPGPATRVVALTAADVEIIFALGAGDTLVGRGEYCNYPPEALDIQSVQSGFETNIEQIIELEPQLLLMNKMGQTEEQIRQLENAGVVTFVSDAQSIDETYFAIESIGILMGKENEAGAVISDMKAVLADLSDKAAAAGGEQKTIYFEVSPLEYGLWTAGTETFMNEVAELLSLRNIFDDVSSWAEISEEQVLERNPDFILTVGMYFGDGPTPIESILSRQGWENTTAIKNKAILNLTDDELSRPGPRLADGARMLYEFVYEGGTA